MKLRIAFAALSLLFVATALWLSTRIGQQRDRIATLESKLSTRPGPAPQPAPEAQNQAPAAAAPRSVESRAPQRIVAEPAACAETDALNSRLHETTASLARAQSRIADLETQVDELNKDRSRVATQENQLQSQIADLNQTIEAMHAERPQFTKQLKDAQTEIASLRQQAATAGQKNAQFGQLTADLKDVARRQQVSTANILRRYRELTDLFRSLPGMVETRGNGPELARIQSAISLADEDLRQLNDLNTRLGTLQNQITTAIASR